MKKQALRNDKNNMKKTFLAVLLAIGSLFYGNAQSNHTVTFSGAQSDSTSRFNSIEKYNALGGSITYSVTFDQTNLYLAAFRNTGSFGASSDAFTVYIDTDPNSTPTSGSGTTAGYSYQGVTGTLPFAADYSLHLEQSYYELRPYSSGAWSGSATTSGLTNSTSTTVREIAIPWSSLGSPKAINITMWMNFSTGIYSNAPGSNVTSSANPTIAN